MLADTSRTRITALINRNTKDISTDLMLRVLGALGVSAKKPSGELPDFVDRGADPESSARNASPSPCV